MTVQLREKKVGPYTVRELPMRETMRILREFPAGGENNDDRAVAMLGASVTNGSGEPLGLGVADLGSALYGLLMTAHSAVNETPVFEPIEGDAGNVLPR